MVDPELDAMQTLLGALEPLEPESRQRVMSWATGRFGLEVPQARKPGGKVADPPSEDEETAAEKPAGAPTFATLGELFSAADPKTNGQKALVVGYWLQTSEGLPDLDAFRVNTELKHLGYGIANITTAMDELKGSKPALAIQLKKSGSSRQARKKYKVTEAGIKAVEALLRGEDLK